MGYSKLSWQNSSSLLICCGLRLFLGIVHLKIYSFQVMTQWSRALPSCCMTLQHMASRVNVKGGKSSGKAPGYFRLPSPECFMYHFHSHPLGRIDNTANLVSREAGKQKTRQISMHTNSFCHKKPRPKGVPWSHYGHCVHVDRTQLRFQTGWPRGLNVVCDDIWSLSWPGHSAIFFCCFPPGSCHPNKTELL